MAEELFAVPVAISPIPTSRMVTLSISIFLSRCKLREKVILVFPAISCPQAEFCLVSTTLSPPFSGRSIPPVAGGLAAAQLLLL